MSDAWDMVVVGGGPAGSVATLVLARAGRRVLLLDAPSRERRRPGESLPGAARPLLRDLGLLDVVERPAHLISHGNASVWGSPDLGLTDFIRDPHGPGWHLDRPAFDAALRDAARAAGATVQLEAVLGATRDGAGWRVHQRGGTATAAWLIDASGRRTLVARGLGARRTRDDPLVALYAWTAPRPADRDTRTLIEAVPDGWWYTARLADHTRVAALHVDRADAARILRTPGAWHAALAATTRLRVALDGATFRGGVRATPAGDSRLERLGSDDWLAVGDAALAYDPLSSQGILTALYSGMKAGQAVNAALSGNHDAPAGYVARLERIWGAYREHHVAYYRMERRWPDHPFWARRHELAGVIAGSAGR